MSRVLIVLGLVLVAIGLLGAGSGGLGSGVFPAISSLSMRILSSIFRSPPGC